nr:MAG TPA: hypothetical protein [Caudoviricetes sp.]
MFLCIFFHFISSCILIFTNTFNFPMNSFFTKIYFSDNIHFHVYTS